MQAIGYAILFLAVGLYLWNESAFLIAWGALGGFVAALALVGLFGRRVAPEPSTAPVEHVSGQVERLDPAAARLMDMGFPADMIAAPLAKARAAGAQDPVAYVMGVSHASVPSGLWQYTLGDLSAATGRSRGVHIRSHPRPTESQVRRLHHRA